MFFKILMKFKKKLIHATIAQVIQSCMGFLYGVIVMWLRQAALRWNGHSFFWRIGVQFVRKLFQFNNVHALMRVEKNNDHLDFEHA